MKQKNKEDFGCIKSYTQCIQWTLGDIPSLGIVNGDYMDEIVYAIVNKLCELSDPLDLSTLSLQCLIDKLNIDEPTPRTIQTIFQLLIDNDCSLKDLIDNLQNQINDINTSNLVLDLKCLAQFDGFGNPLPYDLKSVLQSLINEVCILKSQVSILNIIVVDLQNQINNINVIPFELPTITTCISANKVLDVSVKDIATSLCNLRNATGTEIQLQSAMANQCPNFNTQFSSIPGWNVAPVNLAQSYSNLELAFCNIMSRVIAIEETCCAPSCDKIKIGFSVDVDFELKELTLSFTSGAGTFIPAGFEDCGSIITITDELGNIVTPTNTIIQNNGEISGISFASLTGNIMTISIKTKFCLKDDTGTTILVCQDCISKVVNLEQGCPVCKVCAFGKNGYIDIVYLLNNQYSSIRLLPGQCNYIPTEAKVVVIERTGDLLEDSDCLDLTNLEDKNCYKLSWVVTDGSHQGGATDAWDAGNANNKVRSVTIGNVEHTSETLISDPFELRDFISANVNTGVITNISAEYVPITDVMNKAVIYFKTFPSIASNMYLSFAITEAGDLRGYPVQFECTTG